ncbi:hypothetical protein TELCIR_09290 [Teladorsagia circumcincta]|uniref:Uncharacterized protein n=1 Tax=Teladorsagia circumcincta TaxID=45464 RepID=A0A2G9UFE4_TELCI|nr:hypothetical protein TELCIR_09290 [Teladorsagia circumcincta]
MNYGTRELYMLHTGRSITDLIDNNRLGDGNESYRSKYVRNWVLMGSREESHPRNYNYRMSTTAEKRLSTQPSERRKDWLFAGSFALAHAFLVTVVYHYVPEPYMDEIFHVRQTRK